MRFIDALHVSTSNRALLRLVWRKIRDKYRKDPAYRDQRKALYREALERHAANVDLYRYVMRGGR